MRRKLIRIEKETPNDTELGSRVRTLIIQLKNYDKIKKTGGRHFMSDEVAE
jgi:hypothetical protein